MGSKTLNLGLTRKNCIGRNSNKGWVKFKSGPEEQASFRTAESSQACGQKKTYWCQAHGQK